MGLDIRVPVGGGRGGAQRNVHPALANSRVLLSLVWRLRLRSRKRQCRGLRGTVGRVRALRFEVERRRHERRPAVRPSLQHERGSSLCSPSRVRDQVRVSLKYLYGHDTETQGRRAESLRKWSGGRGGCCEGGLKFAWWEPNVRIG